MKVYAGLKKSIRWKEDGKKKILKRSNIHNLNQLGNSIVRQSRVKTVGVRLGIVKDKLASRIQALEMD